MTELRQQLVDVYATGMIDVVHKSAAYQALCGAHVGDRAFDAERQETEDLRRYVDTWLNKGDGYGGQVEFALRLMRKLKKPEEHEGARALILASYGVKWEGKQRDYFSEKSLLLMRPQHYFLSFTNRNPTKGSPNLVNLNHRYFVSDVLRIPDDAEAISCRNLVAETIHHLLTHAQLDGFYYPQHEGDNTIVEKKLRDNCVRALAFVQLVQGEMFRYIEESPNWCHFEYEVAEATDARRILFMQLDEEIKDDDIYIKFNPWYERFAAQDAVKLKATPLHNPVDIDQNVKLVEKLKGQIDRSINRIYQEVPH